MTLINVVTITRVFIKIRYCKSGITRKYFDKITTDIIDKTESREGY